MDDGQRRGAKKQVIDLMQAGQSWQDAIRLAEVHVSWSTAYRWVHQFCTQGEAALYDKALEVWMCAAESGGVPTCSDRLQGLERLLEARAG